MQTFQNRLLKVATFATNWDSGLLKTADAFNLELSKDYKPYYDKTYQTAPTRDGGSSFSGKRNEEDQMVTAPEPSQPSSKPDHTQKEERWIKEVGVKSSLLKKATDEEWGFYGSHLDLTVNEIGDSGFGSLDIMTPDKTEIIRIHGVEALIRSLNNLQRKANSVQVDLNVPENLSDIEYEGRTIKAPSSTQDPSSKDFRIWASKLTFDTLPDEPDSWGYVGEDISVSFKPVDPDQTNQAAITLSTSEGNLTFNGLSAFMAILNRAIKKASEKGIDILHYDFDLTKEDRERLKGMGIKSSLLKKADPHATYHTEHNNVLAPREDLQDHSNRELKKKFKKETDESGDDLTPQERSDRSSKRQISSLSCLAKLSPTVEIYDQYMLVKIPKTAKQLSLTAQKINLMENQISKALNVRAKYDNLSVSPKFDGVSLEFLLV